MCKYPYVSAEGDPWPQISTNVVDGAACQKGLVSVRLPLAVAFESNLVLGLPSESVFMISKSKPVLALYARVCVEPLVVGRREPQRRQVIALSLAFRGVTAAQHGQPCGI